MTRNIESAPSACAFADEQYASLVSHLGSQTSQPLEHGVIEQFLWTEGMELLRRLFKGHLDVRYENEVIQVKVIGSDGANRLHRRNACNCQLTTLFGDVVVTDRIFLSQACPAHTKSALLTSKI